jgi:cytoskeletal protein RodZ
MVRQLKRHKENEEYVNAHGLKEEEPVDEQAQYTRPRHPQGQSRRTLNGRRPGGGDMTTDTGMSSETEHGNSATTLEQPLYQGKRQGLRLPVALIAGVALTIILSVFWWMWNTNDAAPSFTVPAQTWNAETEMPQVSPKPAPKTSLLPRRSLSDHPAVSSIPADDGSSDAHAKVEDIPDEKPLSEKPLDTAMESHPMSSSKAGAPQRVVEKKGSHKKKTAQGRRRSGDTGEVDQKIDNLIEVQYPLAPISK